MTQGVARRTFVTGAASALLVSRVARADTQPAGTVLQVSRVDGSCPAVALEMKQLAALGTTRCRTLVPWMSGKHVFEGVELKRVLALVGGATRGATATALDGFVSSVPQALIETGRPLVAFKMDGNYIPLEQKGPLQLVFPLDMASDVVRSDSYLTTVFELSALVAS